MREGIKKLLFKLLVEIVRDPQNRDPEVVAAYADNFVKDMYRYIQAVREFREE